MYLRILMVLLSAVLSVETAWCATGAERINAYLDGVSSLSANFTQTLYDEDLNRLEDAQGKLYLQRPGRFRWDYSAPYIQAIVSNGSTLWLYDSELAQVTVKSLDTAVQNTPSLLLSTQQPLEDHFDISEAAPKDGKVWVDLRPKSPEAAFANIRLRFTRDELDTMELVDSFGQLTHVEFSEVSKNPALADDLFEFSPPPGVDVLQDVETSGATSE